MSPFVRLAKEWRQDFRGYACILLNSTNGDGYKGLAPARYLPAWLTVCTKQLHYRVITETGLTTADEMLLIHKSILVDDLVSYYAVGASFGRPRDRFVQGLMHQSGWKSNSGMAWCLISMLLKHQTFPIIRLRYQVTGLCYPPWSS